MKTLERFLKYVSFDTQSDERSPSCPSSEKQKLLGEFIVSELKELGLADAEMDGHGYVYAHLKGNSSDNFLPQIGLIAHMDTSPAVSGKGVCATVVTNDGTNVPEVSDKYIGREMVVTDRTTLLGADDKAGIAEIISALEYLILHPEIKHGDISVGFTPDEEIGRGADLFDIKRFGADFAYTVDGGELGELEYENFNAAAVTVTVHGVNCHPGTSKNIMKNAVLYAAEFISMLPAEQTPAHTEGREGFYHVCAVSGNETEASVQMIIRDHDREQFELRKDFVRKAVEYLNGKYGEGSFELSLKDSYYNMREMIEPHMHIVERAKKAMLDCGITPIIKPIRGGTDGARLSFEGLPCPNISTGGLNFHSIYETIPVDALDRMVEVIVGIVSI